MQSVAQRLLDAGRYDAILGPWLPNPLNTYTSEVALYVMACTTSFMQVLNQLVAGPHAHRRWELAWLPSQPYSGCGLLWTRQIVGSCALGAADITYEGSSAALLPTYSTCISANGHATSVKQSILSRTAPWQPASQAKCCRSTLQSLREANAPATHCFPAVSHTFTQDCPFSPGSACTLPGSMGSGGEGVVGLPAHMSAVISALPCKIVPRMMPADK